MRFITNIFHSLSRGIGIFFQRSKNQKFKTVLISCFSLFMVLVMTGITFSATAVKIIEGDTTRTVYSIKKDLNRLFSDNNIHLNEGDSYNFSGWNEDLVTLDIFRAVNVSITVDGKTFDSNSRVSSFSELLGYNNIRLNEDDILSHNLDYRPKNGDQFVIQRVEYKSITKKDPIPFSVVEKNSGSLLKGNTKISTHGKEGETVSTYKEKYIDGVLVSSEFVDSNIVKNPIEQIILMGTADRVTPSVLEVPGNISFDSNGKPLNYKKVLNGKAAAYSARPGSSTASGRPAIPGHVAVDPRIIPYGTKMYIATPDNSYVYGYAVAADTGTALMEGKILVDVFFNTYQESANFGIKNVNIYILS